MGNEFAQLLRLYYRLLLCRCTAAHNTSTGDFLFWLLLEAIREIEMNTTRCAFVSLCWISFMMYGTDEVALVRQTTDSQQLVTRRCVRIARLLILFLCCLLAWSKLSFVFYLFHICFLLFFTEGLEMTELWFQSATWTFGVGRRYIPHTNTQQLYPGPVGSDTLTTTERPVQSG